jgi:hypothetical protein
MRVADSNRDPGLPRFENSVRNPPVMAALFNPIWTAGPGFAIENGRNAED